MAVITLSASYGAGGSRVGPALAEKVGAEFVDRAIPAAVAEQLAVPLAQAVDRDESCGTALDRVLSRLAPLGGLYGGTVPDFIIDEEDYARATAAVIRARAEHGDVVILGRGGAAVLRDTPGVFHVRLDGPPDRRVAQATEVEGVSPEAAEARLRDTDRAREAYVRQYFRCDPRDARLYHLVLDSTVIGLDDCVGVIADTYAAFERRRQRSIVDMSG
jgi:cytidylate kinase